MWFEILKPHQGISTVKKSHTGRSKLPTESETSLQPDSVLKVASFQPCNILDTLDKHVAQVH